MLQIQYEISFMIKLSNSIIVQKFECLSSLLKRIYCILAI